MERVKILQHDEIKRRLTRMIGARHVKRPNEVTLFDVAKWFGIDYRYVRMHKDGVREINERWQFMYSQFFQLMDSGEIGIAYEAGIKTLVRVPKPAVPPKKKLNPFVDLTGALPRLRMDT